MLSSQGPCRTPPPCSPTTPSSWWKTSRTGPSMTPISCPSSLRKALRAPARRAQQPTCVGTTCSADSTWRPPGASAWATPREWPTGSTCFACRACSPVRVMRGGVGEGEGTWRWDTAPQAGDSGRRAQVRCLDPTPSPVVSCGWLAPPANGHKQGDRYLEGSTVRFRCNNGYSLAGAEASTCRADGTWSWPTPTCQPGENAPPTRSPAHNSLSQPRPYVASPRPPVGLATPTSP